MTTVVATPSHPSRKIGIGPAPWLLLRHSRRRGRSGGGKRRSGIGSPWRGEGRGGVLKRFIDDMDSVAFGAEPRKARGAWGGRGGGEGVSGDIVRKSEHVGKESAGSVFSWGSSARRRMSMRVRRGGGGEVIGKRESSASSKRRRGERRLRKRAIHRLVKRVRRATHGVRGVERRTRTRARPMTRAGARRSSTSRGNGRGVSCFETKSWKVFGFRRERGWGPVASWW
jgi:hypothetical protein